MRQGGAPRAPRLPIGATVLINPKPFESTAANVSAQVRLVESVANSHHPVWAPGHLVGTADESSYGGVVATLASREVCGRIKSAPAEEVLYEAESDGGDMNVKYRTTTGDENIMTGRTLKNQDGVAGVAVHVASPYIAASLFGDGEITCRIWVGASLVSEESAQGQGASVECRG